MMNRFLLILLATITALAGFAPARSTASDSGTAYQVVNVERMKKGGSINPGAPPIYLLIRVEAAFTSTSNLTEADVRKTLSNIISEARRRYDPDAITLFLYQSREHVGRAMHVGRGEWWPRDHSLSRKNARNIINKESYVLDLKVERLPKKSASAGSSRLPDSKRREIFRSLVRTQDRAWAEAEQAFPTDANLIPISKLRTYDFVRAAKLNHEMGKKLSAKYRGELRSRYHISDEELRGISQQAFGENWPLPE